MKSFIIGSEEVEMKKEMTWEEWYYKYYPRVAKMLAAAFYLGMFNMILIVILVIALKMGWI